MTDDAPEKKQEGSIGSTRSPIQDHEALLARVKESSNRLDYKTAIGLCTQVSRFDDSLILSFIERVSFPDLFISWFPNYLSRRPSTRVTSSMLLAISTSEVLPTKRMGISL